MLGKGSEEGGLKVEEDDARKKDQTGAGSVAYLAA